MIITATEASETTEPHMSKYILHNLSCFNNISEISKSLIIFVKIFCKNVPSIFCYLINKSMGYVIKNF